MTGPGLRRTEAEWNEVKVQKRMQQRDEGLGRVMFEFASLAVLLSLQCILFTIFPGQAATMFFEFFVKKTHIFITNIMDDL